MVFKSPDIDCNLVFSFWEENWGSNEEEECGDFRETDVS